MGNSGTRNGKPSTIKAEYWPDLQRMERAGKTLADMVAWLADRGVQVGKSSVHRCLQRIRVAAAEPPADAPPLLPPEPPPALPAIEPATDDDELALLRKEARHEALYGTEWKQRHSAARLLLSIRAERRASKPSPPPRQPGALPQQPEAPGDLVVFN
jgi:hypothetical protein